MEQITELITCPNCGAEYDKHLPKCPYCDYINPEGAEEKYLGDLEKVRQELDHVDELAAEHVRTEVRNSTKKLVKRLILIGVVILAIVGTTFLIDYINSRRHYDYEMTEAELLWQKDAFAKLDSLYEKGSYQEAADLLNTYMEEDHRIWDWKHYSFMSWYMEYLQIQKELKMLEEDGVCSEELGKILVRNMFDFYDLSDEKIARQNLQDENEAAVLAACREEIAEAIHERLGFSEEQMTQFLEEIRDEDGYLNLRKCDKIAVEYYHQFR